MIDTKAIREDVAHIMRVYHADGDWDYVHSYVFELVDEQAPALCDRVDELEAALAAAEARAEELLLLYGEEHERAERLAAYVRASEQLRHAEIMLGNSEDHTSQSRTWSYAVMEADCKLIAARGEFQPGDLGEL